MTATFSPASAEAEAHTVASAWSSSGLGLPGPEDSATVFVEHPDDERRTRRGALLLFAGSGVIAGAAAVGALLFGGSGPAPVVAPGGIESAISSTQQTASPTQALAPIPGTLVIPTPVAPVP